MNEQRIDESSDSGRQSGGRIQRYTSMVLAASTLLLVILFAASLFIPSTRQKPASPAEALTSSAAPATGAVDDGSSIRALSGNPLLASIIVVVLTFLIIERVRDINSRISEVDKGLRENNSKIQKSVEDATESQVKRLNERLDNLKGKLDGFERRYPWLQTINESGLVINVNSSIAILETVAGLILSQQRAAAYEWLAGAAKDSEAEGLPLDFLAIATVCRLLFNDRVLAEKFIARAESASRYSSSWRVAKLVHLVETGQYAAASTLVLDTERRLLPGLRLRLRMTFDARYRRQPKVITPELVAALHHYYTTIGDVYGLERVYPSLVKKISPETLTLADEVRATLLSAKGEHLGRTDGWHRHISSPLTAILLAEAHIDRALSAKDPNWEEAYAAVDFARRATGNQAFAKALSAHIKENERASKASLGSSNSAAASEGPIDSPTVAPVGSSFADTEPSVEQERADPDPFGLQRGHGEDGSDVPPPPR